MQAQAHERLYLRAAHLTAMAQEALAEQREEQKQQQLQEASQARQEQLGSAMSRLSAGAVAELSARHNQHLQRRGIRAVEETTPHQAGHHCRLTWSWPDASGASRVVRSSGLGETKRQAVGEAMRRMLKEQGVESFEPEALCLENQRVAAS